MVVQPVGGGGLVGGGDVVPPPEPCAPAGPPPDTNEVAMRLPIPLNMRAEKTPFHVLELVFAATRV